MTVKLLAIGVGKYVGDKMNILDGSVVMLSIFEIVYGLLMAGEGVSMKAMGTMRLIRTFRVFRIARLLTGLQQMQMIFAVIAKSYMSFFYMFMLMMIFIFIFSLIGISLFGNQMNYPDGLPRGNFDSFSIAFVTVF